MVDAVLGTTSQIVAFWFGYCIISVLLVLLDVTTSSGLKETSKLWRLLVERDAGNRCTNVHYNAQGLRGGGWCWKN